MKLSRHWTVLCKQGILWNQHVGYWCHFNRFVCPYQNLKVVTIECNHSAMIGPTLIHCSKNTSNFSYRFNELVKKCPSLLTSFGTDGEQALINAASQAFPFAVHLRCANHLKDNISESLCKMLRPDALVREVLRDIFGTMTERGLIHAPQKEFDSKLASSNNTYTHLVCFSGAGCMCSRLSMTVWTQNCLIVQVLSLNQKSAESISALIKKYISFKKQDVCSFMKSVFWSSKTR